MRLLGEFSRLLDTATLLLIRWWRSLVIVRSSTSYRYHEQRATR